MSTAPPSCGTQHNKMSKRHGDPSYEDLKAQGYLTEAILNYVALLGWSPKGEMAEQEFFTLDELVDAFDIAGISKSPAIFDIEKLTYFNANYLRAMTPEDFCQGRRALYPPGGARTRPSTPPLIAALLQARCEKLTEIPEKVDFFDALPEYDTELLHQQEVQDQPRGLPGHAGGRHPRAGGAAPTGPQDAIHDALIGSGRKAGGQERHPHVACPHRRGRQGW